MKSKNFATRVVAGWLFMLSIPGGLPAQEAAQQTRRGLELMSQGRYQEAEEFLRHALEIAGPADPNATYNLASLYHRMGRFPEAERLHQRALEQIERTRGPFDPEAAQSLNDLGALYRSLGRYSRSIAVLERSIAILDRNPPQKFASTVFNNLGNAYLDIGHYGKADAAVRRGLAAAESGLYEDASDLGFIQASLGRVYFLRKQFGDAETAYRNAASVIADTLGSQHPEYGLALTNIALVYERQRRYGEALPLLESAIDILERSSGRESPMLTNTLYCYSEVMKGLGRKSEARQIERRAKSLVRPDAGTIDVEVLRGRHRQSNSPHP